MRLLLATTAALALLTAGAVQAQTGSSQAELRQAIARDYDANLGALFDDFHRNPELSGLEVRTAGIMAAQLTALGYDVTTGVGGTGVAAVLRNGDGPTVMVRADMDGLPLAEAS
ncbi:MAG: amidohydrolase, partial [Brevundimonas sp.]|nr:amidohydrolase [Brevundimonas sp.]